MARFPHISRSRFGLKSTRAQRASLRYVSHNAVIEMLEERRLMSVGLISVNSQGVAGNGASDEASVSSDGTYVAFSTFATNLGGNVQSGVENVYLRDTQTDTTTLVSVGQNGAASNGNSNSPKVSANGQFVTWASSATNLTDNDANGSGGNVFVRNMTTGVTTCITAGANKFSGEPVISADGTYVAFSSYADNIAPGVNNSHDNVFETDLASGYTILVSTAAGTSNAANGSSFDPSISGGGSYVTFRSTATNLENTIPVANSGGYNVYIANIGAKTISLVSVDAAGTASGNGDSISAQTSDNGEYVVFRSAASNLVANDTNNQDDVFLRNTQTNTTTLLSENYLHTGSAHGLSEYPSISDDGVYAAFSSTAPDVIPNDTNTNEQVYVSDLSAGAIYLISVDDTTGGPANAASYHTYESSNGQYVSFTSAATDLVPTSNNGVTQVYIATAPAGGGGTTTGTPTPTSPTPTPTPTPDTTPPSAVVDPNQTAPTTGASTYDFTVDLSDNTALNTIKLGPLDVTGPAGAQTATYVSEVGSGTSVVATYQITFASALTSADDGTYNVSVPAGSVLDASGNDLTAGKTAPVAIGSFSLNVAAATAPDLTGSFVGKLPVAVIGGKKGSAKLVITNVGVNPIVKTKLSFALYVSETPTILPGASPVRVVVSKISLKHGKSTSVKFNFVYPASLPDGQYYLVAQLDSTKVLQQTDAANNVVATASTVTVAPPFKALSAVSVVPTTGTLVPGGKSVAVVTIKNSGNTTASGPLTLDFTAAASSDDMTGTGEALGSVVPKIHIGAGATARLKVKFVVSPSAAAESGFLSVTVDPTNAFKNPDQDANIATSSVGITIT